MYVILDGRLCNGKGLCYFLVGQPIPNQGEHLTLAARQHSVSAPSLGVGRVLPQAAKQYRGDSGRADQLSARQSFDRRDQLVD